METMETLDFFLLMFKQFFSGLLNIFLGPIKGIIQVFDFGSYSEIVNRYLATNGKFAVFFLILVIIIMAAILAGFVFLIVLAIKKIVKVTATFRNHDRLLREVGRLNKEVAFYHAQMDKALKKDIKGYEGSEEPKEGEEQEGDGQEHRFSKLLEVDEKYKFGNPEQLNTTYTLEDVCHNFRMFAASRLKLYYDEEIVREFVSAFSSVRLIILQGISGTGKTSLPYAFGKFLNGDGAFIQAIQPSWRERSEMLGFFNEFTKKYKEPEFLRNLYEANYSNNIHLTVLDEMNIARVEYYFAEFLSTLEMPRREEWIVELVAKSEPDDPRLLKEGKMCLPPNMWYVGTANNDDSTFAISDKVYDRAVIIDIDKKYTPFEPEDAEPMALDYRRLDELFKEAKEKYIITEENYKKISMLDAYVIEHFRIAFGNRILRQLQNFVPAYMACGGTQENAIDFILLKKVFRKFALLSTNMLKKEYEGFLAVIDSLWGEDQFPQTRAFMEVLSKRF